jgi:hypothetical protein
MGTILYLLCTATAIVCCLLLLRGWRQSGARLLFWSALCFATLALENFLLFLDLVVLPAADLSPVRVAMGLMAVIFLLYGLIWHEK